MKVTDAMVERAMTHRVAKGFPAQVDTVRELLEAAFASEPEGQEPVAVVARLRIIGGGCGGSFMITDAGAKLPFGTHDLYLATVDRTPELVETLRWLLRRFEESLRRTPIRDATEVVAAATALLASLDSAGEDGDVNICDTCGKEYEGFNCPDYKRHMAHGTDVTHWPRCENCGERYSPHSGRCVMCGQHLAKDGSVIRVGYRP